MRPLPKVSLKLLKKLLPRRSANVSDSSITISSSQDQQLHEQDQQQQRDDAFSPKKSDLKQKQRALAAEPPEECPICHDPVGLANPEGVVESWTSLHCGHRFGTHCIQTWLQESINRDQTANPSCPICRTTAKHPCGHLVSPPPFPAMHHHHHNSYNYNYNYNPYPQHFDWAAPRPPPSPPRHQQQRQVRRRLTRRPGHPLRPPPQQLSSPLSLRDQQQQQQRRRTAQVVGECRTCAENAVFDARMQRIRERGRQATGDSAPGSGSGSGLGLGSSRGAAAFKAMIPGLGGLGLKRSNGNHATFRATVVHVGLDPLEDAGAGVSARHHQHQNQNQRSSVFCGAAPRARRGTPPPGYSRRLSI